MTMLAWISLIVSPLCLSSDSVLGCRSLAIRLSKIEDSVVRWWPIHIPATESPRAQSGRRVVRLCRTERNFHLPQPTLPHHIIIPTRASGTMPPHLPPPSHFRVI